MLNARFSPLGQWPGAETKTRKSSLFRATYESTLDMLESELWHLGATETTIHAGFALQDIRNDGWPRAGKAPSHPGIILTSNCVFQGKRESITLQCDTYLDWKANLRAIALTLEAMRAVDRYGVSQGRQYEGFKELPSGQV